MNKADRSRAMQDLHDWRKRVKDLWYELRILKPIEPKEMGRLADDTKRLAHLLGDDHDLAVLEEAAKSARLDSKELKQLSKQIHIRRAGLQRESFQLGHRLYQESPSAFVRRIQDFGKAWQNQ
jgi:CHAD domain-containing protein